MAPARPLLFFLIGHFCVAVCMCVCYVSVTVRSVGAARKLAVGNIEENLKGLASLAEPPMEDPVARKIWCLCDDGCEKAKLMEGIVLLQHLGWSSTTVEQQHASATLVKRQHHKQVVHKLCTRAMLHTSRLFYAVDPMDSQDIGMLHLTTRTRDSTGSPKMRHLSI